jgi:hypothetical protein
MNNVNGAGGTYYIESYERPLIRAKGRPEDWSNSHQEFLAKQRELLKELGPILVEEGLLAK